MAQNPVMGIERNNTNRGGPPQMGGTDQDTDGEALLRFMADRLSPEDLDDATELLKRVLEENPAPAIAQDGRRPLLTWERNRSEILRRVAADKMAKAKSDTESLAKRFPGVARMVR
jgi:hypothetical protein